MLKLKEVEECLYPKTIEEAAKILKQKGETARIVGGGLHLTAFPNPLIKTLIFLNQIGLDYIEENGNIRIGSLVSLTELIEDIHIKKLFNGKVSIILNSVASELLRNQISIGGSIAQREPYSDVATILLTLNSKVVLHNGESFEVISLEDFYSKNFRQVLKESVIKEVQIEYFDNDYHFGMERFIRNATDIPLLNLAMLAKIEKGTIKDTRVFVGARPSPVYRFLALENFLNGKENKKDLIDSAKEFARENVEVESDIRISKDYRKHITGVFVEKILTDFLKEV